VSWLSAGWQVFDHDPALAAWLEETRPAALAATRDPQNIARWLRCGGTWFAGVNLLENDGQGRVAGSAPLLSAARREAEKTTGPLPLDRGQISVTYPGYPRPGPNDSPANFRFRRNRDAAHVDGLPPIGPDRRRHLHEPHGWILGLPLTECSAGASPLVVWQGSHDIMRRAFRKALGDHAPRDWPKIDLTAPYHAARREVFATCKRIELEGRPGQAHLLHRLTLHGVAPWAASAKAPPEGRIILYFRPELPDIADWLALP
jgi:hypothetical protein